MANIIPGVPTPGDPTCALTVCGRIIAQVDCIKYIMQGTSACIDIQLFGADGTPLDLDQFCEMQIQLTSELECVIANFWYPSVPTGSKGFDIEILQYTTTNGHIVNKGLLRICLSTNCTLTTTGAVFAEIILKECLLTGQQQILTGVPTPTGLPEPSGDTFGIPCLQVASILNSKIAKNGGAGGCFPGYIPPQPGSSGIGYAIGATGSTGVHGSTGPQGEPGLTGSTGFGATGSTGPQGDLGLTGSTGPQGDLGLTGSTGFTGSTGVHGSTGSTGSQGNQGFIGSTGPQGAGGALGYWGSFWSTQTQIGGGFGAANVMTFNNTDPDSNGVSIQNNTELTFAYDGVYNVQFSAQIDRIVGPATSDELDIWFAKNGVAIPDSNTTVVIAGLTVAAKEVAAWNYQLKVNAGDYIELYWSCPNANVELVYVPTDINPIRPAVPSVILTAQQVMYTQMGGTGATGPQGDTGATGPQGFDGATGPQGDTGATGLQGDIGATGPQGDIGATGPQGFDGATGPQGDIGSTGSQGFDGATGPQGFDGSTGFIGSTGVQGNIGATGSIGSTGAQGNIGATGAQGVGGAQGYYGSFIDTTDQTLAIVSTPQRVSLNTTQAGTGISLDGGNPGRIVIANPGTYSMIFSIELANADQSNEHYADIWLKFNGSDYPDSNTRFYLPKAKNSSEPAHVVATVNFVGTSTAPNDYIELWWSADDVDVSLETIPAGTSPVTPLTPSVICTLTQVMNTQLGATGSVGATGSQGNVGATGAAFSSPYTGNIQINGQAWVTADANGNTSSSTTVDWDTGNVQTFTLNAATTTFTFSNGNAGASYILIIKQNAAGSQVISWPAAVTWSGGSAPTMTPTANRYDVFSFIYDGTKYFGSYVQNFT